VISWTVAGLSNWKTTEESVLGSYFHYVFIDDKFIIIVDLNGIYKFSSEGKFIKKIIRFGRGPDEFTPNPQLSYSSQTNLLYINDNYGNKNILSRYDVKSEKFLEPVKKCFPGQWGSFILLNDSTIIGSIAMYESGSNPYALFTQNLQGEFLSGIYSKSKAISLKNESELQRMLIIAGDNTLHAKYYFTDTIFKIDENKLYPWLMTEYNLPQPDQPHANRKIGEKRSSFERFENPGFMIFRNLTYKGLVPFKAGVQKAEYDTVCFFINKSNGKYAVIKSYSDDLSGKVQASEAGNMVFPSSLPNNLLYSFYYPYELLSRSVPKSGNRLLPENIYKQLNSITVTLKETDNPILFIGVPKKDQLIP